jgi:hypothetical protein
VEQLMGALATLVGVRPVYNTDIAREGDGGVRH